MQPELSDSFSTRLEVCYEILLYLAYRIQKLSTGEVLEFVACDPNAPQEVLPWIELRGYELLEMEHLADGQIRFLIRR